MAFVGADVLQMQELETTLRNQAEALKNIMSTIKTKVYATEWRGSDAEAFKSQWDSVHTQSLNKVVTELQNVANTVKKNKEEQERVSGTQ